MIYGYKYKSFKIEKFHDEIMYFFKYLLENEPKEYDVNKMFNPSFKPLIEASKKFEPLLKELIEEYAKLDKEKKRKIKLAFKNNNQIKKLCNGSLTPVQYEEFKSVFSDKLKVFFEKLWDDYSHNKKIETNYGTVKEHFDLFVDEGHQEALICPFCGLSALKPSKGEYRDAYDHYLPKSLFPFTSMNFKNLVPTCQTCNSRSEKGDKPVIYNRKKRQRVFFPFDTKLNINSIKLEICPSTKYNIKSKSTLLSQIQWEYSLKINNKKSIELIQWENIYGIQRRSKEYMLSMEKSWFSWILDRYKESIEDGVSFSKFKDRILLEAKKGILSNEKGLMKYAYISYLLSQPKIEERLRVTSSKT